MKNQTKTIAATLISALISMACGHQGKEALVDEAQAALEDPTQSVTYDQVYAKSIHNAYGRRESILDQMVFHDVRTLEFDIVSRRGLQASADDWYVYHEMPGPDDLFTHCLKFSDCLEQVGAFHKLNPSHAPVTIFVDMKNGVFNGSEYRTPEDFDAQLEAHLGANALYRPRDIVEDCFGQGSTARPRIAVETCGWPTLAALDGKILVVLTGASEKKETYIRQGLDTLERSAFVASKRDSNAETGSYIFFNYDDHTDTFPKVDSARANGFVTRMYDNRAIGAGGLNKVWDWQDGLDHNVNFIATDYVNVYRAPVYTSMSDAGYPFRCHSSAAANGCDLSTAVELLNNNFSISIGNGGTIGGAYDNAAFYYRANTSASTTYWSAHVGNSNAFIRDDAQAGCLMARQTFSQYSPFFAICRRGEKKAPIALWRKSTGETGSAVAPWVLGVNGDNGLQYSQSVQDGIGFLRLMSFNFGRTFTAQVSRNGTDWVDVAKNISFNNHLYLQGVAASAVGTSGNNYADQSAGRVEVRFSNVIRRAYSGLQVSTTYFGATTDFGNAHLGYTGPIQTWSGHGN